MPRRKRKEATAVVGLEKSTPRDGYTASLGVDVAVFEDSSWPGFEVEAHIIDAFIFRFLAYSKI